MEEDATRPVYVNCRIHLDLESQFVLQNIDRVMWVAFFEMMERR